MVALGVQDPDDDDEAGFDAVEELVREAPGEQPAEAAVINRTPLGLLFEKQDGSVHLIKKLITQARPL